MAFRDRLRIVRRIWVATGASLFVIFALWSLIAFQAWGVDESVLRSGSTVEVHVDETAMRFIPSQPSGRGLLLFPGGLVDPEAYAPIARAVAEAGHEAVIVRVPWRGMFNIATESEVANRGRSLMNESEASEWVVAGHSKGGVYASALLAGGEGRVTALVLAGTSHPRRVDLSSLSIPVVRLIGDRDLLASPSRAAATRHNLPPHAVETIIPGANHSGFGWYGFQPGDLPARISKSRQQSILMDVLLGALTRAQPRG